jgi:hypothetical protein
MSRFEEWGRNGIWGPARVTPVEKIDFDDFDARRSLKHRIWGSRDAAWLRGASLMLLADLAEARQHDEPSQTLRESILTTDDRSADVEWLSGVAEFLLESNRKLAEARALLARGRSILEREVIRDDHGLISHIRETRRWLI